MVVKIDEPKTPFHYETKEEADEDEVRFHSSWSPADWFLAGSRTRRVCRLRSSHRSRLSESVAWYFGFCFCPSTGHFMELMCCALTTSNICFPFNITYLQHASPEHVSSPDCLAGHHSDTSLHSEHSSDSEDIFEAKRKQHYRMGAALKGQAPMGM